MGILSQICPKPGQTHTCGLWQRERSSSDSYYRRCLARISPSAGASGGHLDGQPTAWGGQWTQARFQGRCWSRGSTNRVGREAQGSSGHTETPSSGLGMWPPPPGPAAAAVGCSFFAAIPSGAEAALPHSLRLSVSSPLPLPHPSSAATTARPHAQCSATPLPNTRAGHSNVGRQQRSHSTGAAVPRFALPAPPTSCLWDRSGASLSGGGSHLGPALLTGQWRLSLARGAPRGRPGRQRAGGHNRGGGKDSEGGGEMHNREITYTRSTRDNAQQAVHLG